MDIDLEVRSKLLHLLAELPPGSCFTCCQISSFTGISLRCMIGLPKQSVRFLVPVVSVRDGRGDFISAGQPIYFGTKGWILGDLAGVTNDSPGLTIVRFRQVQTDTLEIEVDISDVIILK